MKGKDFTQGKWHQSHRLIPNDEDSPLLRVGAVSCVGWLVRLPVLKFKYLFF